MEKNTPPPSRKFFVHHEGTGVPDQSDLRKRAEELALIAGHAEPTAVDFDQARRELGGEAIPATSDVERRRRRTVSRDPSEPPGDAGEENSNQEPIDEQMPAERLVLDGVEEAQHEQMLADRRRKQPD
jgi:hypothetical protein